MTEYSLDMRAQMTAESADEVVVSLLTFTHPSQPQPLRISSDRTEVISYEPFTQGTVSRGETYWWVPMAVVLPGEGEDVTPEIRLTLDLIDRDILVILRSDPTPAQVTLEIVSAARPDVVEIVHEGFEVQSAPYDETQVSLIITQKSFVAEPHPADTMTPLTCPGLFR